MSVKKIGSAEVLAGLVREAIFREKLAEAGELWRAYGTRDEMSEDVLNSILDLRVESEEHVQVFLELARELGEDVDLDQMDKRTVEESLFDEGMTAYEALSRLREYERGCGEFYSQVASRLHESEIDGVDAEAAAEVFEEVSEDEKDHLRRVEELLEDPDVKLGDRLI